MESVNPLVSIVMTVFNHKDFVVEAIDSCLNQTYKNIEVIVVDDGSTDGSWELIQKYRDPRVVSFQQENSGPSVAFNRAVSRAKGRYLACMSGDDVCLPERISTQVGVAQKYGDDVIYFSSAMGIDEHGHDKKMLMEFQFENQLVLKPGIEVQRRLLWGGNFFCGPTAFMATSAWDRLGGYNPYLFQLQDYEIWLRFSENFKFAIIPEKLVKYRMHSRSLSYGSRESYSATLVETASIVSRFLAAASDSKLRALLGSEEKAESRVELLIKIGTQFSIPQIRTAVAVLTLTEASEKKESSTVMIHQLRSFCRTSLGPESSSMAFLKKIARRFF